MTGRVVWRAGSGGGPGRFAGCVGWRARWSEGMDLQSQEFSGVNMITKIYIGYSTSYEELLE